MAQAQVTITGRRDGKTFPTLDAWIAHVAQVDIPALLPAVALQELHDQKAAGNPPSNILIDGRAGSEPDIVNAKRRVQMFFLDVELLARAVQIAYEELRRLYTRATGQAAGTIQVWGRAVSGASITHQRLGGIGAVADWLAAHRNPGTYIRLIGPDVAYRRHLYYTPPGSRATFRNISRFSERRLTELERQQARARAVKTKSGRRLIQIASSANVSDIVLRKMGAQFGRALYISARWVRVPVPPWKGATKRTQGVPAIAIGWRLKGAQLH
jgi:hypothetical protein